MKKMDIYESLATEPTAPTAHSTLDSNPLGSGQSSLADEVNKARFATKQQTSELSDTEIKAEIDIALKRARLRHSIRSSIEGMEYASLHQETVAARVEGNNQTLSTIVKNISLERFISRQKDASNRLNKALKAQQDIAGQLPPYSGMT